MKKVRTGLILLLALLGMWLGSVASSGEVYAAEPWREAFATFLRNNTADGNGGYNFAIHDLMGDGNYRLFISDDRETYQSYRYANGAVVSDFPIYTASGLYVPMVTQGLLYRQEGARQTTAWHLISTETSLDANQFFEWNYGTNGEMGSGFIEFSVIDLSAMSGMTHGTTIELTEQTQDMFYGNMDIMDRNLFNNRLADYPITEENIQQVLDVAPINMAPAPTFNQTISPEGYQLAKAFLSDFHSIFQDYRGWRDSATEEFYIQGTSIYDDVRGPYHFTNQDFTEPLNPLDTPLFYIDGEKQAMPDWMYWSDSEFMFVTNRNGGSSAWDSNSRYTIFDLRNNLINNPQFIRDNFIAEDFEIYDFTGNGIPEIVVQYRPIPNSHEDGGDGYPSAQVMYQYINGHWIDVFEYNNFLNSFYVDGEGNLILFQDVDDVSDREMTAPGFYYFLLGTEGRVEYRSIPRAVVGNDWSPFYDWRYNVPYNAENPDTIPMFGTNTPITRIRPITSVADDLRNDLTEHMRDLVATTLAEIEADNITFEDLPEDIFSEPELIIHYIRHNIVVFEDGVEFIHVIINNIDRAQINNPQYITIIETYIHEVITSVSKLTIHYAHELDSSSLFQLFVTTVEIHDYIVNYLIEQNIDLQIDLNLTIQLQNTSISLILPEFIDELKGQFDNLIIETEVGMLKLSADDLSADMEISINIDDEAGNQAIDEQPTGVMQVLNYWATLPILALVILWGVLARKGHHFRLWVVPTFSLLFILLNLFFAPHAFLDYKEMLHMGEVVAGISVQVDLPTGVTGVFSPLDEAAPDITITESDTFFIEKSETN